MKKIKFILLILLTILTLNSCRIKTTEDLIEDYINDILGDYSPQYYTYTYEKLYGNFYIENAEHIYVVNLYMYYNIYTFICYRLNGEIYWEEMRYRTN